MLDALPGEVRAGNGAGGVGDHPAQLIDFLRSMPLPIQSRSAAVAQLTAAGALATVLVGDRERGKARGGG